MSPIVHNIIIYGAIGCFIFTVFLILIAYSGIYKFIRHDDGQFKSKLTWQAVASLTTFLIFLTTLLYLGNIRLLTTTESDPGFYILWANASGIFLVIHLYDLVIIDYLIVVKWHPGFLKMPDTEYYTTFKPHLVGFVKGLPFGVLVSMLVTILSTL